MPLLVSLACSLLLLWPILSTSDWYSTNQGYRYPYLLIMFKEQWLAGHWYPRWLPGLMGGYGYPTFIYYPAGFWFVALPFTWLIPDPVIAVKSVLLAVMVVGGIGAYRLTRCFCSSGSAWLGIPLYYLSPVLANLLYERGDFAELMAMLLCPWVFCHMALMSDRLQHDENCLSNALWLGACLAAVVYVHPMITVWLAIALALCVAGLALDTHAPWRLVVIASVTGVLAVALSSPYWFPSLALRNAIDYGTSLALSGESTPFWNVFTFDSALEGLVLPALALAGFYCRRKSRFTLAVLACAVLFVGYMLPVSLRLRRALPVLDYLQMPGRVLTVVATLQLIGIAFLLGHADTHRRRRAILTAGTVALALQVAAGHAYYQSHGPVDFEALRLSRQRAFEDMTHTHEFRPKAASTQGLRPRSTLPDTAIASMSDRAPVIELSNHADSDIWLMTTSAAPERVLINQFYFPGWKVEIDGVAAAECLPTPPRGASYCSGPNGRIVIAPTEGGQHKIHVWYEGAPDAAWRNAIASLVAVACLLALGRWCDPNRWRHVVRA